MDKPSISLMVTGQPWERTSPGKGKASASLSTKQQVEIMGFFRNYYPRCMVDWNEELKKYVAEKLGMDLEELQKALG